MATQHGWAIAMEGERLYIGWQLTRGAAIAAHVLEVRRVNDPVTSGFYVRRRLDEDQAALWKACRQRGDRVVRVKITYAVR